MIFRRRKRHGDKAPGAPSQDPPTGNVPGEAAPREPLTAAAPATPTASAQAAEAGTASPAQAVADGTAGTAQAVVDEGREGLRPPGDTPHGAERPTRRRLPPWDRVKYLLLLTLIWFVLVWAAMADNPLLPFTEAMRMQSRDAAWVFVLAGLELVRQVHFLVSERWSRYHRFWTHRVFGGFERFTHRRFSPWTRFRVWRATVWLLWIAVAAVVTGKVLDTSPVLALFEAPALLWQALPFLLQIVFLFFVIIIQFVGLFWFLSRGGIDTYMPDDITTRFDDVWGQDHVVERVKENIVFLERPREIEERGGYVPGGILLWGPPGTGKTLMAEAVAGETGKPYVFVDPGAFVQMFMGVGVLKVKSLFRKLRKLALRYGGVIVFFDEADSLGRRGALAQVGPGGRPAGSGPPAAFQAAGCHGLSYLSPDARRQLVLDGMTPAAEPGVRRDRFFMGGMGGGGGDMGTLQALLTELSGLKKPRGIVNRYVRRLLGMKPKPPPKYRILVMMATNMPQALDEALLRPGRIDRIYKVGYPAKAGRVRTYEGYFAKVRHELTPEQVDKLATITPYATGATIKDLVNEALIIATRDDREVITWADVMRAKQLKSLGPPEGVEYHERERHATAVHEACHAVVAYRVRRHLEIDIATIEKGAEYLGMVASIPAEDQFTQWRSEYEADILVSLASLAGERMFFGGDSSSGVSGDLEAATRVASLMEGYWGMGSTVSSHAVSTQLGMGAPGGGKGAKEAEQEMRRQLADRIEDQLGALLARAEELLKADRRAVLALAHALETHKTLQGEDIAAVIEGRRGPLVDGRIYADDDFAHQVEAYHRSALAAHRDRGKVQLTLPPVLNGQAPGIPPETPTEAARDQTPDPH
ncbi:ATP-dependent Zn proteases [Thermomonospora echinospora]|uniref:ATP-dependent Zn proteases n=1 Tax=Thermomonospora echinospora TaxID=1992 RepID=A0A1H5SB15_9ACTN|nr:AAA family ATPase [Thermomonospora echinospora]SEF47011.1 ATP-dependent Zn proteases [Thermomonospora echinospora]